MFATKIMKTITTTTATKQKHRGNDSDNKKVALVLTKRMTAHTTKIVTATSTTIKGLYELLFHEC